jgi:hypothetical protein
LLESLQKMLETGEADKTIRHNGLVLDTYLAKAGLKVLVARAGSHGG